MLGPFAFVRIVGGICVFDAILLGKKFCEDVREAELTCLPFCWSFKVRVWPRAYLELERLLSMGSSNLLFDCWFC